MIDLATTTGANAPAFIPNPGGYPFWVERPMVNPFVEAGTIGFTAGGRELADPAESWLGEREGHPGTDVLLDDIVAWSRQDAERYPSSARVRANLGLALLNRGMLEEAAAEFATALELDPWHYVATANLARTRVSQGRLTDAQELYRRLREDYPSDPSPVMGLAGVAEREEDLEEAVRLWGQAIELRPSSAVARSNLGAVLLRLGRHREAIASLKQAARVETRRATIYHALGVAYALVGEQARAVRSFRTALALNPRMPETVQSLATVLLGQERAREAVEVLEGYVGQVSGDFEAHEQLAWAYARLGNYQAARLQWFRALGALRRSDNDMPLNRARLINNLGVCLLRLGALDEAHRRFQDSIALSPESSVPYQNLARLYLEAERPQDAAKTLRACAARFSEDEETRLMLAYAMQQGGQASEALAEIEGWVASSLATVRAWAVLGYLLTDVVRQPAAAVRVLEEARRRWPEDVGLANNLAYAHLMNETPESARTVLESLPKEAERQDPTLAIVLQATWGLLRLWEGDFEGAEQGYRKAAETAEHQGLKHLARMVRQKMHLELARAHRRAGNAEAARRTALKGLPLPGERHYRQDLRFLAEELRAEERQTRQAQQLS